ncbi:hypothetical protein DNTS_021381 [Danionella cerebrum]|uniref:Uncharacterized protein n=1 Tax=Danionella cerebrum TaxID=2873325 RepID=A0A553R0Y3_9TELE|nr:hypothetical protein DNTS_021381 [Danionella translucida]
MFPRQKMSLSVDDTVKKTLKKNPDLSAQLILKEKAEMHYKAGIVSMSQSQFDNAISCFSKAILLVSHQTQYYVQRAEAYLHLCDFQSAALDYKCACRIEPQTHAYPQRLAFIYYLQGQCLFDLGKFMEALESFTNAAELKPDYQPYHMRSMACLTALGRYFDCLRLVNNWLEMKDPSADLFILRARLHHQLNQARLDDGSSFEATRRKLFSSKIELYDSQMTNCYHDLRSALTSKPSSLEALELLKMLKEAAEECHQNAVEKALKGDLSAALRKINCALEYNPRRAQYHLFRGTLYRRLKDFTAAIEDLAHAFEFCGVGEESGQGIAEDDSEDLEDAQTQLVLTYNDFAMHCFSRRLYKEATLLLNKAIEKHRDASELFVNRGDCFLKQGEWTFALADYEQAEEMDPDNTIIWLRCAVIYNKLGLHCYESKNYLEAADKFSAAINYDPGVAQYYANRAKAFCKMGKMEGAKEDAISVRVLEPNNEQASVLPLLLSLFPGFSLNVIMTCSTAQSVKDLLKNKIEAFDLAASKMSRIDQMALVKEGSISQSSSQAGPEHKMKPSGTIETMQSKLVAENQSLNQAVKRVLQQRQSLQHDGPCLAPAHLDSEEHIAHKQPYVWRKFGSFGLNL